MKGEKYTREDLTKVNDRRWRTRDRLHVVFQDAVTGRWGHERLGTAEQGRVKARRLTMEEALEDLNRQEARTGVERGAAEGREGSGGRRRRGEMR